MNRNRHAMSPKGCVAVVVNASCSSMDMVIKESGTSGKKRHEQQEKERP
ncbi:MAG: hypothetical protein MR717_09120 [Prevotella sp.]|nr:hypothetical protein [Prevotella sp.]